MNLREITGWLDRTLDLAAFDDVSNNGLQIDRDGGGEVSCVAFGVDASAAFLAKAADAGAQLCVVHHGISWGGGVKRLVGSAYEVAKTAIRRDVALYAAHLPLDANRDFGNNWGLARRLGLEGVAPAFAYHGNVIGVTGTAPRSGEFKIGEATFRMERGWKVGVCSGGAGEFAEKAKALGCDLYLTGEASWGEVVAARNVGMRMALAGHYATETVGVSALAEAMASALGVKTFFIDESGA